MTKHQKYDNTLKSIKRNKTNISVCMTQSEKILHLLVCC